MKNTHWTLLAALLMAAPHAAQAQAPGTPGGPGGPPPGTPSAGMTAPTDAGAVSNSTATTDTTTTTTGISPDATIEVTPVEGEGTLADTGGAPLLMSLSGLALAAAAFGVRRRIGS